MLGYLAAGWGWQFANAFGISILAAISSFFFSMLIGIGLTLFSRAPIPGSRAIVNSYTYVFRSLPDILLLLLIFYTLDGVFQAALSAFSGGASIRLSPLVPAIMSTSIVLGAYATELFKAGWADIPAGQHEAGQALGLTRLQALVLVILPQVYSKIIPHLGALWLISMKETALLSIIGISDIVRVASIGARSTGAPFVFYGIGIIIFVVFAAVSARVFKHLERRSQVTAGGI